MPFAEIKKLNVYEQRAYYEVLRKHYCATESMIGSALGVSQPTINKWADDIGVYSRKCRAQDVNQFHWKKWTEGQEVVITSISLSKPEIYAFKRIS